MSVIQKIQEKYAKLMAIIIALALIIFVVMLAFENGGNLFQGGNTTSVGKVNGKSIDYNDFLKKIDQQESYMEQQGYGTGAMLQQQANEAAWNQEINMALQNSELKKVGIKVGSKEMGDILYGSNPPDFLKKEFTDSAGFYNGQMAKQRIDQILKLTSGRPEELQMKEQLIASIAYYETNRLDEKYRSLFGNSANVPKWLIEKENADKSQMARISIVRDNYAANTDSTIRVTDKEIEEYISKNKDDYKQEESRSISYVTFSALPSSADSAEARNRVASLKAEFDTVKNVATFLNRNGSITPYADVFAGKSLMQMVNKDTIQSLPLNAVFGPYLDGGNYALAKLLDVKQLPDSVKCRHVLVGTNVQQGGYEDSVASRKIDSIRNAISGGASWAEMVEKYNPQSDGSRQQKGEMTFSSTDIQADNFAKEFAQFILFDGKPGERKVVKTSFGYHYIEIMSFIKPEPHYKVAFMAKKIETSPETENGAENEANLFAGNSRDAKSFDANAEKLKAKGINKNIATEIKPMAYQIPGLGSSRTFVKNIYKAKLGEVLDPERVGDNFVVATVTEINEEGTMSVAKARLQVEPLLKNKKVAEKLKQKLGAPATLEAAAASLGGKPVETIDSLRMTGEQTNPTARLLTSEPKVIGAAFNPSNKGKIVVIEGANGIYAVRIDNVVATPVADANVAEQRKTRYEKAKQQATYRSPIQALRNAAKIKDRRSEFF